VSLGEERWLSGTAFEDLRRKNPGELKRMFTDALKRTHSLVKAFLLERLDKVPLESLDQSLIALLSDPSPAIRLKAIDLLRSSKTPPVIAALEKVVDNDTDANVKTRAVVLLDGFGVTKYRVFILFDKLRSGNDTEVLDAIDQLIASGDPRVTVGLASVLGHANETARQKATDGILKFNDAKGFVAVLERADVPDPIKERFAMALVAGSFVDLRAKGYAWVLVNGTEEKKVEALKTIAEKRETALLPRVQDKLTDPSAAVARQAAATLAAFKDVGSLEKLVATAQARPDLSGDLETAVITIIGSMRLPDVIGLAKSENFTLRKFATKSLAEFTKTSPKLDPKVQAILEERMLDQNIEIKRAAVYALARAKNEAIVTKLAALADDPDDQIREQVLVALTQLPVGPARDIFLKKLDDPYDPVRLQAIKGIRLLKVAEAIQKLSWLRQTPKADLRIEVVTTLAELMNPEERKRSFDMWSEALYDQEVAIKTVAMEVLSCIKGDPRVAPTLSALVLDPDRTIKTRALGALAMTGDPAAVEYIVQGLFDLDTEVKKAALEGLRTLHVNTAEKPLQEFVKNEGDPELRRLAEDVLTSLL
jgi:HEAT repeat protein